MPNSREEFNYLEISRPVSEAADFLEKVKFHGSRIFGEEYIGLSVTEGNAGHLSPAEADDHLGPPILVATGIPRSNLMVYPESELRVMLLERRIPPELNPNANFNWVAGRLFARGERIHRPIKKDGALIAPADRDQPVYRNSPLYSLLDKAGVELEIMPEEQRALPVWCRGLTVNNDPSLENDNEEIALTLSPADKVSTLLTKQSRICFRGLASYSKKAAYPTSQAPLNIPFARIPQNAEFEDKEQFVKVIEELLPIRLMMGYYKTRVNRP